MVICARIYRAALIITWGNQKNQKACHLGFLSPDEGTVQENWEKKDRVILNQCWDLESWNIEFKKPSAVFIIFLYHTIVSLQCIGFITIFLFSGDQWRSVYWVIFHHNWRRQLNCRWRSPTGRSHIMLLIKCKVYRKSRAF